MRRQYKLPLYLAAVVLLVSLHVYGADGGRWGSGPTRTFWMGTTPFSATPTSFPYWKFENLNDKDLLSIHADDFWGVPWDQCNAAGCSLPASWAAKWATLANAARATRKTMYLAVSPLGARKTLAAKLDANGNKIENWAPVDGNGCYDFANDANAANYKAAYVSYVKYLINLIGPRYVSPAIEMNIPFSQCPSQKSAWIAWYRDVHNALKTAHPSIKMFATFQMEHMYGISDAQAACAPGTAPAACFDQRLAEALAIPGDRIAFSSYPIGWKYRADYSYSYPTDTFVRVKAATTRKIWIAETGWAAVKVLQSYPHGFSGVCGFDLFPETIANNMEQEGYLRWLLGEAQARGFEAVIWWLNRDYLDGAVAATCPCDPMTSDTCVLTDTFYRAGGVTGETLLRIFGNMALRHYDGSPRPAHAVWRDYVMRRRSPTH